MVWMYEHVMFDNSNPKENIIHFMLPKDKLVSLVEQPENKSGSARELMTLFAKTIDSNVRNNKEHDVDRRHVLGQLVSILKLIISDLENMTQFQDPITRNLCVRFSRVFLLFS